MYITTRLSFLKGLMVGVEDDNDDLCGDISNSCRSLDPRSRNWINGRFTQIISLCIDLPSQCCVDLLTTIFSAVPHYPFKYGNRSIKHNRSWNPDISHFTQFGSSCLWSSWAIIHFFSGHKNSIKLIYCKSTLFYNPSFYFPKFFSLT